MKDILDQNIVLTYDRHRVVAGATPHSLKVWADADMGGSSLYSYPSILFNMHDFCSCSDACDKATYDYIRAHPEHDPSQSNGHSNSNNGRAPSLQPGAGSDENDSDSDIQSQVSDADETFKLVLRSAATGAKTFTLTVRQTTTCGAIVKAFLKKAGRKGGDGARLVVDGEKMDPGAMIQEADLEDGDQVEVTGV